MWICKVCRKDRYIINDDEDVDWCEHCETMTFSEWDNEGECNYCGQPFTDEDKEFDDTSLHLRCAVEVLPNVEKAFNAVKGIVSSVWNSIKEMEMLTVAMSKQQEINNLTLLVSKGFGYNNKQIIKGCYENLKKLGRLKGFKEPTYWVNAYEDFVNSKPNFSACMLEFNYYLFSIACKHDKEISDEMPATKEMYGTEQNMNYKQMMFLFVAMCQHFYDYEVKGE